MTYKPVGARQISEMTNRLMDPVLSKRAGINTALLGSWDEIAGSDFAGCTRPEKITWPRRSPNMRDDHAEAEYQPGILTIACEGARALFLTHAEGELIQRINGFFGYPAIRQIKIVQKPVSSPVKPGRNIRPLDKRQALYLEEMVAGVETDALKEALKRLGTAVMGQKKRK